jgi:hypothetical protein
MSSTGKTIRCGDTKGPRRLHFCRIDIDARSTASASLAPGHRKGICLYVFSDGISCVDKSIDIEERLFLRIR